MILAILTTGAFAGCWMNPSGRFVRWDKPTTIKYNGLEYFSTNHSIENLEAAGYYYIENTPDCPIWEMYYDYDGLGVYQILTEETNIVIEIDQDTKSVAQQYAWILGNYFPDVGAITNRIITEEYVTDFFSAKLLAGTMTASDLGFATLVERFFMVLKTSPYNPTPNTTWDFPFGQDSVSGLETKRYYLKDGEKIYVE